jgi:protein-tyrosine-phosphatase
VPKTIVTHPPASPPTGAKKRFRVLFVCLGNACRSPMAEAIARREARDIIEPLSAGLIPLGKIPELTIESLLQNGYSAQGLASKPIDSDIWDSADVVINLSGKFKENTWHDHRKVEDWRVDDPYLGSPTDYQRALSEIEAHVRALATRLRVRGQHAQKTPHTHPHPTKR